MTEVLQRTNVFADDIYNFGKNENEAWTNQEIPDNKELSSESSFASDSFIPEYKLLTEEDQAFYRQDMRKVKRCLDLTPESFSDPEVLTKEEHLAILESKKMLEEVSDLGSSDDCPSVCNSIAEDCKLEIFQQRLKQALSEEELTAENSIRIPRNIIIASPTQNGKTQQVINIITSAYPFTLSVVSCDNKTDQLQQFVGRLKEHYLGDIFTLSGPIKAPQLKKIIRSYNSAKSNKRIVLVLLNNSSQCKKLRSSIHTILNTDGIDIVKYQLIHDEADLVNKSGKAEFNGETPVAAVQTEWLSHLHDLKNYPKIKQIKRIWVSATPENCSLIKDVKAKDVLVMPKSDDYRSQIKFTEWSGDLVSVSKEVQRINKSKSREAILYCTEATNAGQEALAKKLTGSMRCPVILYNGEGIVVYLPLRLPEKQKKSLPEVMESLSVRCPGAVIVVGHALMNRGISFVGSSESSEFPVTATVMFYNGSSTIHTVGIAQRIGRITGKSRPDIVERRLYSQRDIYDSYCKYLKNQNSIYEFLESPENAELLVADILKTKMVPNLEIIKRPIDRKEVMPAFDPYKIACITSQSPNKTGETLINPGVVPEVSQETETMKRHVLRWMNPLVNTDISKVFKTMYSNERYRILTTEISRYIKEPEVIRVMTNKHANNWNLVFSKNSQFHHIKPEAITFANSLTKN